MKVPINPTEEELYDIAVKRINTKKSFITHFVVYSVSNIFLIVLSYILWNEIENWIGFVIGGWGIGLAINAVETYTSLNLSLSSKAIQNEMDKIKSSDVNE